jgi:hypothetical protein
MAELGARGNAGERRHFSPQGREVGYGRGSSADFIAALTPCAAGRTGAASVLGATKEVLEPTGQLLAVAHGDVGFAQVRRE